MFHEDRVFYVKYESGKIVDAIKMIGQSMIDQPEGILGPWPGLFRGLSLSARFDSSNIIKVEIPVTNYWETDITMYEFETRQVDLFGKKGIEILVGVPNKWDEDLLSKIRDAGEYLVEHAEDLLGAFPGTNLSELKIDISMNEPGTPFPIITLTRTHFVAEPLSPVEED